MVNTQPATGGSLTVLTPEEARPGLSRAGLAAAVALLHEATGDPDALSAIASHRVVGAFEERLAGACGATTAVAVSSGTLAIVTALLACGVEPGDEVIVASYGWGSTVGAVLAIGAIPVFADIEASTLCLDAASVAGCITSRTRAVLATHLFGMPADVVALEGVARSAGVRLVFDAAQALGATVDGRAIGSFGDATVLSFGRGKLLPLGEGGAVLTSDAQIAENAVLVSQHPSRARREIASRANRLLADEISLSSRLHPLAAAIGTVELQRVDELVARRRATCLALCDGLARAAAFGTPERTTGHAFHALALTYRPEGLGGLQRDIVLQALRAKGVPAVAGPVRTPIHRRARFSAGARAPLGARCGTPVPLEVTEDRCARLEILLESESRWLAVPPRRVQELVEAFERVGESRRWSGARVLSAQGQGDADAIDRDL